MGVAHDEGYGFPDRGRCTLCGHALDPPIVYWWCYRKGGKDLHFCTDCAINLRRGLVPDLNEVWNAVRLRRMGFADAKPSGGAVIVDTSGERH